MTVARATLEVLILQDEDRARERELTQAVDLALRAGGSGRMNDNAEARRALEARNAFVAEMAQRATVVKVGALTPRKWREICRAHPAREDNPSDAAWGYDTEAVATAAMFDSLVEPAQATEADLEHFLDSLRNADLTEIEFAICRVNDGDLGTPKEVSWASLIGQNSDET